MHHAGFSSAERGADGVAFLSARGPRSGLPARRFDARRALPARIRKSRRSAATLEHPLDHRGLRRRARARGRSGTPGFLVRTGAHLRPHRLAARRRAAHHRRCARQRDRHRRRPRHHGSGESRRGGSGRTFHRFQHHAARRAGAERLLDTRSHVPLPLLRDAQDASRHARAGAGGVAGRLRHAR